eukprot:12635779-Ditylum_brightwellii.AAC.1
MVKSSTPKRKIRRRTGNRGEYYRNTMKNRLHDDSDGEVVKEVVDSSNSLNKIDTYEKVETKNPKKVPTKEMVTKMILKKEFLGKVMLRKEMLRKKMLTMS